MCVEAAYVIMDNSCCCFWSVADLWKVWMCFRSPLPSVDCIPWLCSQPLIVPSDPSFDLVKQSSASNFSLAMQPATDCSTSFDLVKQSAASNFLPATTFVLRWLYAADRILKSQKYLSNCATCTSAGLLVEWIMWRWGKGWGEDSNKNVSYKSMLSLTYISAASQPPYIWRIWKRVLAVSYTHLTLPTRRTV